MATGSKRSNKTLYGVQIIGLDLLVLDHDLQSRVRQSLDKVREYADHYLEEPDLPSDQWLPPIVVFHDPDVGFLVADGWHRVEARRKANFTDIRAEVRPGGKDDALLFSVGANAAYGIPRTDEDKRKAVLSLLNHVRWCMLPIAEIAKHCKVSYNFVRNIKTKYEDDLPVAPITKIGSNGRLIIPKSVPEPRLVGTSRPTSLPQGIEVNRGVLNEHYGPEILKRIAASDPTARANVPTKFGTIDIATDSILYWFAAMNDPGQFWRQWGISDFQRCDYFPDARMAFIGVFSRQINQIIEFARRHRIAEFYSPDHFIINGA